MNSQKNIYSNDIEGLFNELNDKELIIYGAGKIGKSLISALSNINIAPKYIWDNNATSISGVSDSEVTKPHSLNDKSRTLIIVTIFSQNISQEISEQLTREGYDNIISDRSTINALLYASCQSDISSNKFKFNISKCHICPASKDMDNRCDIYDDYVSDSIASTYGEEGEAAKVIIPSMGLLVHNDCNLTCNGCNHLRDLYRPSDNIHIEASETLHNLRKVIDAVDFIEKIVVVGGEAFIHKEIYQILDEVIQLPKIGIVQVITNGIQMPKNRDVFRLLSNPRVIVEVSGYGSSIPEKTQAKVQRFLDKLEEHKVSYEYMNTLQWFDFGGFESRNYSVETLKSIYKKCCFVSNDLFNGELHKCSRSVFSKHLNKIPLYKNDYVDVKHLEGKALRKAISSFLGRSVIMACQHCGGTSTSTIPAGVQVIPLKEA